MIIIKNETFDTAAYCSRNPWFLVPKNDLEVAEIFEDKQIKSERAGILKQLHLVYSIFNN